MNHITLLGRLVKDPEIKYTPSEKCVAQFTLAVDRPFKNADGTREADFVPVVVWNRAAELVGNSCVKGHRLLVEGRLQIRSYQAKDGTKKYITEVIANSVEFIEKKTEGNAGRPPHATMQDLGTDVTTKTDFDEEIPF